VLVISYAALQHSMPCKTAGRLTSVPSMTACVMPPARWPGCRLVPGGVRAVGTSGEVVEVRQTPDMDKLRTGLQVGLGFEGGARGGGGFEGGRRTLPAGVAVTGLLLEMNGGHFCSS
jgi:hypothetical protein